ncbi:MAG: hypothetical protein KF860_00895 [Cyclobacteriaceae bacterium]|nr:hypothetical protein [Cyclobacteriaceae bacterium]
MKRLITLVVLLLSCITGAYAQCAMCRATLENNVSNGETGIAAGINFGIMYLFFAPYLAVGVVAYFWYKTSKSNARKEFSERSLLR